MAKVIKKACKGTSYPKSSNVSSRLGSPGKAKSGKMLKKQAATAIAMKAAGKKPKMAKGGSFPDLNKDGKITKKDVLIGRGVLPKTAQKGMKVKKAQNGVMQKIEKGKSKGPSPKFQMEMEKFKYQRDMDRMKLDKEKAREEAMRPKGLKVGKKGVKMTKKCAYGCK